jgi:hypothetical protein
MFLTNDNADRCPIMQEALKAYAARLQREHEEREAIRRGDFIPVPFEVINISDRH